MEMTHSPGEGFETMIGTYWVRQQNGVFRHTTERQSELKITLAKHHVWTDYFKEVPSGA